MHINDITKQSYSASAILGHDSVPFFLLKVGGCVGTLVPGTLQNFLHTMAIHTHRTH